MRIHAITALVVSVLLARATAAQHATGYDIQEGSRVFQGSCAACHGPDGDLIAGIDFGRGVFRRPMSDEEIAGIVMNGIPGTPMPPSPGMSQEQALRVVAYLRSMPASTAHSADGGDSARGRAIFEGRGHCLDCHRVASLGSRVGPDLSSIGLVRRAGELEQSLLDPNAEVQPNNRSYRVELANGTTVTGRLLNQDTFTVQIMDTDERLRSFDKANLVGHGFIPSPMPSARDALSSQEIRDVVAYLVSLHGEAAP
jgi:putative heme-binding domain-containing protein